jgi:hypothetical protein
MVVHFVRMGIVASLLGVGTVYPFLPGDFDGLAVALSTTAQSIGVLGLLLVPIGIPWLIYEVRKQVKRKRGLPHTNKGYRFAMASLMVATQFTILVSLIALLSGGLSFGVLTFVLGLYLVSRGMPGLKLMKTAEPDNINPTPLYLIFIPAALLLIQLALAAPATEFSRNRAIAHSAEFIHDIEAYRKANGHYPASLLAIWKDYTPSVVGIEKFHYAPNGGAYNLFFEQPRFLLDHLGTREFVVYNPLDEHMILSHTSWILLWSPERLPVTQGWYAIHESASPHWKYFWFD